MAQSGPPIVKEDLRLKIDEVIDLAKQLNSGQSGKINRVNFPRVPEIQPFVDEIAKKALSEHELVFVTSFLGKRPMYTLDEFEVLCNRLDPELFKQAHQICNMYMWAHTLDKVMDELLTAQRMMTPDLQMLSKEDKILWDARILPPDNIPYSYKSAPNFPIGIREELQKVFYKTLPLNGDPDQQEAIIDTGHRVYVARRPVDLTGLRNPVMWYLFTNHIIQCLKGFRTGFFSPTQNQQQQQQQQVQGQPVIQGAALAQSIPRTSRNRANTNGLFMLSHFQDLPLIEKETTVARDVITKNLGLPYPFIVDGWGKTKDLGVGYAVNQNLKDTIERCTGLAEYVIGLYAEIRKQYASLRDRSAAGLSYSRVGDFVEKSMKGENFPIVVGQNQKVVAFDPERLQEVEVKGDETHLSRPHLRVVDVTPIVRDTFSAPTTTAIVPVPPTLPPPAAQPLAFQPSAPPLPPALVQQQQQQQQQPQQLPAVHYSNPGHVNLRLMLPPASSGIENMLKNVK